MWIRILLSWVAAAAVGIWIGTAVDEYRRSPEDAETYTGAGRDELASRNGDV